MSAQSKETSSLSAPVSPFLITAAAWSWRFLVVAAALVVLSMVALRFLDLLIALFTALLIAVVAEPLSTKLQHRCRFPKSLAAATVVFLVIFFVLGLLSGSALGLYAGFNELGQNILAGIDTVTTLINRTFPNADLQLSQIGEKLQKTLQNNYGMVVTGALNISSSLTGIITGGVLAAFSLFFFLKDGRGIWHWCVRLLPKQYRTPANEAGIRAWITLGNYTRTQAIVAIVDAIGIAICAACLSTPFSLLIPIAALVFLGSFIPIVGSLLSGAIAVLVVLVNTSNLWMALLMLGGVILVQQIEGNLLQPILQGKALNLHPLAIVLIVAGGTGIAGILGAIFAVPLVAAFNTALLYLNGHDIYPYLDHDPHRPGGPKQDFAQYCAAHWQNFEQNVAQHLPPKAAKQARKEQKRLKRSGK